MSNKVNEFQILNADDDELMRINQEGTLSLNLNEMWTIQSHFAALQRNPTNVQFETILRNLVTAIERNIQYNLTKAQTNTKISS